MDMHRKLKLWAAAASVAAVLAVLIAAALLWNGGRASGSRSPGLRQAFAFDALYAGPDPKVLVVRYGDSSSCPSKAVRHTVLQERERVVVTLTRAPMPDNIACTSDYGARLVRVWLAVPLANRLVIDGSRERPVPVSAGLPPFG
jgi:hypothetical protein